MKNKWYVLICIVAIAMLAFGCDSEEDATETSTEAPITILRSLFPSLSESDLLLIVNSLTMDQIMVLKAELEETRKEAATLSDALFTTAEERVNTRQQDLSTANNGFPTTIEPIVAHALYNSLTSSISVQISGVFRNSDMVAINDSNVNPTFAIRRGQELKVLINQ